MCRVEQADAEEERRRGRTRQKSNNPNTDGGGIRLMYFRSVLIKLLSVNERQYRFHGLVTMCFGSVPTVKFL